MDKIQIQQAIFENIKELSKQISEINDYSELLTYQQKIQMLYEEFIYMKKLNSSNVVIDDLAKGGKLTDQVVVSIKTDIAQNEILVGIKPIKLGLSDSISFLNKLFEGKKVNMDKEIENLNKTKNIAESKKWLEEMFYKYNWKNYPKQVERLSELIINRFS